MDKRVVEDHQLLASALDGLRSEPKRMDSKWFYDHAGSVLFEDITELPEYYPTRTEISILHRQARRLAQYARGGSALVELGAGASTKTRILLDHMHELGQYVPIDISADFLVKSSDKLAHAYPHLEVAPLVADFMSPIQLPASLNSQNKVVFFPGSTIGNLDVNAAIDLLARTRTWGQISAFIVGIDLVKDPATLIRAYDDGAGVTASFNLNLLWRLNREIGANFEPSAFSHEARWNEMAARIEMHLVSSKDQVVQVGSEEFTFSEGESIHTENSHKYTQSSFSDIAAKSGWHLEEFLTDPENMFALAVLIPRLPS